MPHTLKQTHTHTKPSSRSFYQIFGFWNHFPLCYTSGKLYPWRKNFMFKNQERDAEDFLVVVVVTRHHLIGFKTNSMGWNPCFTLLEQPTSLDYIGHGQRVKANTIFLLQEYNNKITVMAFCYSYRSLSCSAIITGVSSYSRWEQIPRPTMCKRARDLGPHIAKWDAIIKPLP